MSDERSEGFEGSSESARPRTLLEAFDHLITSLPAGDPMRIELLDLRPEISEHEETIVEAGRMIEKLEQVIKKVTSPANRIGTFLGSPAHVTEQMEDAGADYYCNVDPRRDPPKLQKGTRDLVNGGQVNVKDPVWQPSGPVTKIAEVLGT